MTSNKELSLKQQMAAALRRLVAEVEEAEAEYDDDDECVIDTDQTAESDEGALRMVIRLAKVLYPTRRSPGRPPADDFALADAAVWLMHLAPNPTGPMDKLMPLARALLDRTEPAVVEVVADIHGKKPNAKSLSDRLRENRDRLLTIDRLYIKLSAKWAKRAGLPARSLEDLTYLKPEDLTQTRYASASPLRPSERAALQLERLIREHFDILPPAVQEAVHEVLRYRNGAGCGDSTQK